MEGMTGWFYRPIELGNINFKLTSSQQILIMPVVTLIYAEQRPEDRKFTKATYLNVPNIDS